jgi:hypothetical protein
LVLQSTSLTAEDEHEGEGSQERTQEKSDENFEGKTGSQESQKSGENRLIRDFIELPAAGGIKYR